MAWTQTDLDNVEAAIIQLAQGKRVSSTNIGGNDRDFEVMTLRQALELRAVIVSELAATSEISGGRRVSTTVKSDTW
jgi:hypothetical protein